MAAISYLRTRYREILSHTGLVLTACALIVAAPIIVIIWRHEESLLIHAFAIPAAATAGIGLALWLTFRSRSRITMSVQEGGVIVVLSWILISLLSAWPFTRGLGLPLRLAFFEAVSGWTTTGLSILDVSETPHIFLLWRSIMQLAGGAGLAIIMLSSIVGPTGAAISVAEGRDQLLPQVRRSAKLVLTLYSSYVVIGTVGLYLAGMSWFDAVNHAFCALSTGGFSTRPESIGYWDSVAVEAVILPLMLLGNLSFLTAWAMLRGRFRAVARNGELRLLAILLVVGIGTVFLLSTGELYETLGKRTRVAIFEVVSALTTTGYSTVGYSRWNGIGFLVLIVCMVVGGGAGSTAGGMKQYRIYLLIKNAREQLRRIGLPRRAVVETSLWVGEHPRYLSYSNVQSVSTFATLYFAALLVGVAVMTGFGYSLRDSVFEYASTVGTVGLSVGITSAEAPATVHWVQIVGMFLGRLEFFVVLSALTKLVHDSAEILRGIHRKKES